MDEQLPDQINRESFHVPNQRFREFVDFVGNNLIQANKDGSLNVPDEFELAFLQALHTRLGDPQFPIINNLYSRALSTYPNRSFTNIARNGTRCGYAYELEKKYPGKIEELVKLDRPTSWDEYLNTIEDIEHPRHAEVIAEFGAYFEYNVQTTVLPRIAPAILIAHLFELEGPVKVFDIGTGSQQLLKAWALRANEFEFETTEVMERGENNELFLNESATEKLKEILENRPELGESVGIDILEDTTTNNGKNRELAEWRGYCFYMSEYISHLRRILDYKLMNTEVIDQIQFFQGNVTELSTNDFGKTHPGYLSDITLFCTVAHQMSEDMPKAREAVDVYSGRLKVYQDFVVMQPAGTMDFSAPWNPWTYRTYVEDKLHPELGVQHFFTIENGRVPRIILETAAARLAIQKGFHFLRPIMEEEQQ